MTIPDNPLTDSTDLRHDGAALRQRARQDGYLLIRGLLPREVVDAAAAELAATMAEAGWIPAGRPLDDAPANADRFCVEPQPAFMDVFYRQLALRSLHALKLRPELMRFFETLFGETPFCPPHFVTRLAFPDRDAYATPAHQDYVHFEGSRDNWAAWIPFTTIDAARGGLAIAAGSHRDGAYDMRPALGAGQMAIDADLDSLDWRWSPMRPGDVLIHNCLTVHKGLPNRSAGMRVSMDCRYQPLSQPIGEKFLGVSHQLRTWDELYRDWPDDAESRALKYDWRDLDLDVVPFTYHWYDRRDATALAMAEAGDAQAAIALENIARKHRDPAMRARAERALAGLASG